MKKFHFTAVLLLLILVPVLFGGEKMEPVKEKHTIIFETTLGKIEIEVYPEVAPRTVENFTGLVNKGYYNGIIFHRVIPNFMIQGGDPTGTGTGGESIFGKTFEDEINAKVLKVDPATIKQNEAAGYKYRDDLKSMHCVYGTICMANAGPNTNGSQFFIVTRDECKWLDGRHTVFGKVVKGMDIVEKISNVPRNDRDKPHEDVKIVKAYEVK